MNSIEKDLVILAQIEKVWIALTDAEAIRRWMGDDSSVKVDLRVGGEYSFFGNDTTGKFTRIEKPNLLEYAWRMAGWDQGWPDSLVRWQLAETGKGTHVRLFHSNLPNEEERDGHDDGWDIYFLEPMREWVESWTVINYGLNYPTREKGPDRD